MGEVELRAGDDDRDRVASALRDHLVAGRLTTDEFVERVERAHDARTLAELDALQRDLPAAAARAEPAAPPAPARPRARWLVAVMSGIERSRRWRLSQRTNVIAVMGGADLDLRQAELEALESEILVVAVMGGVEIVVPEGLAVEVDGFAFMGGKDVRVDHRTPAPGEPVVRIRVLAIMGGCSVRSKPSARGAALPVPPLS
jgi:hypothetical protein